MVTGLTHNNLKIKFGLVKILNNIASKILKLILQNSGKKLWIKLHMCEKIYIFVRKVMNLWKKFIKLWKNVRNCEKSYKYVNKIDELWKKFINYEKSYSFLKKVYKIVKKVHKLWKEFIFFCEKSSVLKIYITII